MSDASSALQSTAQSIARAITTMATTWQYVNGQVSVANLTGNATLVYKGQSRVTGISVTTVGNSTGTIYDSNTVGCLSRPVLLIANTTGFVSVGMPMQYGIVCQPGGGNMSVAIVYSPQPVQV